VWTFEEEQEFRGDLIEKLIAHANSANEILSRSKLGNFDYIGNSLRMIHAQGGILAAGKYDGHPDPETIRCHSFIRKRGSNLRTETVVRFK
jgi:hypothetical protein